MCFQTTNLKTLVTLILLLSFNYCFSQKDTVNLRETIITDTKPASLYSEKSRIVQVINREEIAKAPVQSINELLEYAINVDVRNRGANSVQSDIGIRGGSFEQTLVLLNGVKINDPQTGHHTMNIPVELSDVERIEILEGPGSRIYGVNAFAGAINIVTNTQTDNFVKLSAGGGEYQTYNTNAAISFNNGKSHNYLSISKKTSDGYINNTDYNIGNIFYQSDLNTNAGKATVQFGYTNKKFGANEFYSSAYPNEFEQTKTYFANAGFVSTGKIQFRPTIYYRRNQDRFELFRSDSSTWPSWYKGHNYHLTNVYGAELSANVHTFLGKTTVGGEFRRESILSNVLGTPLATPQDVPGEPGALFTKSKSRDNLGLFAEHLVTLKKLAVSAGVYINHNSDFGWNTSLSADASYKLSDKYKVFASTNQSIRLPTYTDLYYVGPSNQGNIKLVPEEATTYETGLKYITDKVNAHVSIFRRDGKNLIDWVKPTATSKWESRNITQVIANGIELSMQLDMKKLCGSESFLNSLNVTYSYLTLEKQSSDFISYYALDYLRNKLTLRFDHTICNEVKASWAMRYHDRAGTYSDAVTGKAVEYSPYFTTDLKIYIEKRIWSIYVEANNLFDAKYQDIGNIQMPGSWFSGGVTYKIFYK